MNEFGNIFESWLWWKGNNLLMGTPKEKLLEGIRIVGQNDYAEMRTLWLSKSDDGSCPFCHGFKQFMVGKTLMFCLCEVLKYLDENNVKNSSYNEGARLSQLQLVGTKTDREQTAAMIQFIKSWVDRPDMWIVLQGNTGCGKTHTMHSLKNYFGKMALYITAADFQQRMFSALRDDSLQSLIETLQQAPILLFDDWGLEHDTKFTTDTLASVIDNRYTRGMAAPTVVTTNLEIGDLLSSPNLPTRRIASRVMDRKLSQIFILTQPDFRSPIFEGAK